VSDTLSFDHVGDDSGCVRKRINLKLPKFGRKRRKKREDFGSSQFERREGIEKESKLYLNLFDVVFRQPI